MTRLDVAIVDHSLGNLFSVLLACRHAGLHAEITADAEAISSASSVVLPGVGAFGDAMVALRDRGLVEPLRDAAGSDKPFIGVCLGLQLLMSESVEFGEHQGLGIVPGKVLRFPASSEQVRVKVPQVGWNDVVSVAERARPWGSSLLAGSTDPIDMYFVHSYYVVPEDDAVVQATTVYGGVEYCSAIKTGSVEAFQFHPERSGPGGLRIYENLAARIRGEEGDDD